MAFGIQHVDVAVDEIELPRDFPFHVQKYAHTPTRLQRFHCHTCHELNHIMEGCGHYVINGVTYVVQTGDLVVLAPNDVHCAFGTEHMIIEVITFDSILLANEYRNDPVLAAHLMAGLSMSAKVVGCTKPRADELRQIFLCITQEYREQMELCHTLIRAHLVRFIALLYRSFRKPPIHYNSTSYRDREIIRKATLYMDNHLGENITLKTISNLGHLSPSRFSHIFRENVGISPRDYLLQQRVSAAIHWLITSDDSIASIATACGFRNLSNFNRIFSKYAKRTPTEIRSEGQMVDS